MILGIIGVLVSLALLITLAYRGVTVVIAAPTAAIVAMVFSQAPLLASYTEVFMPALGGFITKYFPMFLTGAIFGKLMTMSGFATDIARTMTRRLGSRQAMLTTVLTTGLLTYGGISVFVVVFVMFPLARELFREADIPRRLLPATIAHGMLTFTMTALPGSPQVQNIIPAQAFQTTAFAAPVIGLIGGTAIFVIGMIWLEYRKRRLTAAGESFADLTTMERRSGAGSDVSTQAQSVVMAGEPSRGSDMLTPSHHLLPFIPVLLVFIVNFGCTILLFPAMDWGYLEQEQFGGITVDDRAGVWAVLLALFLAAISILLLNARDAMWLLGGVADGARNALLPIFNTASEVGYGAVIASLGAFALIRDGIFGISDSALVSSAVSTSVIAGVTGSASGGMTIALNAFGDGLAQQAAEQGISLEVMHRITAMASGGLDSMPHNGAVITLLMVCGMTHRESYKDVGVITLVIPVVVTAGLISALLLLG